MAQAHRAQVPSLSWQDMVAIEPALATLYADVRSLKDPGGRCFCVEALWHRQFKPRLTRFVGFRARDPRLRSMAAYDAVFEKVYEALPPCRGCACVG